MSQWDWSSFPTIEQHSASPLYRIHRRAHEPQWFNNDGAYRFDPPPTQRDRFGTCYLGAEPLAAYVEVFGRFSTVAESDIRIRDLTELHSARALSLANLMDRSVLGAFGITATYSMGGDYGLSQALASDLFDAGFDGIRYRIRHDPAMELEAVAMFGEPGVQADRFGTPKSKSIPHELVDVGDKAFGIRVVPSTSLP